MTRLRRDYRAQAGLDLPASEQDVVANDGRLLLCCSFVNSPPKEVRDTSWNWRTDVCVKGLYEMRLAVHRLSARVQEDFFAKGRGLPGGKHVWKGMRTLIEGTPAAQNTVDGRLQHLLVLQELSKLLYGTDTLVGSISGDFVRGLMNERREKAFATRDART